MTGPADGGTELLRLRIRSEHDVFTARQLGREVGAALRMEHQDQIRVATALSEVGRQMLAHAGGAVVTFRVNSSEPMLRVEVVTAERLDQEHKDVAGALAAAARLVEVEVLADGTGTRVRLDRRLPQVASELADSELTQVRAALARLTPTTAMEELAAQNADLLATLGEVQRQRDELLRLNSELEETNRGVLALYRQLSDELEETNRGVVALYAELDQRSAELRMASEAKSRFLANASHELRAPLTAIIGLTRLLADAGSAPLTAEQAEQVDLVHTSATDLLALVNDLLDLAKAESGRIEPALAEVRLSGLFGQLRGTLRPLVSRSEVTLLVDEPVAVPALVTDEMLLTQVLRNLVTNGLKFTEQGTVRVSAQWLPAEGLVELDVVDTGIGIPAAEQERIFEEFYQVRGASQAGGTGLGLPYARRVVNLLGGTLTVESEPGKGSQFRVRLPRVPPRGATPLKQVLVVNGDTPLRSAVARALRDQADQVSQVVNAAQALASIAVEVPDVVVVRVSTPAGGNGEGAGGSGRGGEPDGVALIRALAADERLAAIPVVVVTEPVGGEREAAWFGHAAAVLSAEDMTPDTLRVAVRDAAGTERAS
ncbi:MAG TPA: sensor histidine kinase [Micromonosporaceae bacterium]|nr:sensor histidine kinase [Micromonosporaceae bacterium]